MRMGIQHLNEDLNIIKEKVENGEYNKVQSSIYIETSASKTNYEYEREIIDAVGTILPYYKYVIGKENNMWLLTWNESKWIWPDYENICSKTKNGEIISETWTCSSKKPKIGDDVYLIKLGDKPRGILAHGFVSSGSYMTESYDSNDLTNHIDVEFDRILNYKDEKMLSQEILKDKFPNQQWSPQGSGISIKEEYTQELSNLWNTLLNREWWPSKDLYNPNLTKEEWLKFINEYEINNEKSMMVLKCYFDIGGIASPKQASEKYGGHPSEYTSTIMNFCKRAINYFNLQPCPDGDNVRYFPIAFYGKAGHEYQYRMRPELLDALKECDLSKFNIYDHGEKEIMVNNFDKNLILYGPPGTGKTYNTINYAVAICEDKTLEEVESIPYVDRKKLYEELKKKKRIEFTTFHQSYGYEEFIEGIKPKMDSSDELEYSIESGVFKEFCERAKGKLVSKKDLLKENAKVWCCILGGNKYPELKDSCFNEGSVRIGWDNLPEIITSDTKEVNDKSRRILLNFQDEMEIGDIVVSRLSAEEIDGVGIITGEQEIDRNGTEFIRKRKVEWLTKNERMNLLDLNGGVKLDRKTIYPLNRINALELLAALKVNSDVTFEKDNRPYVFIIDEINRGNISKIFGELITLIEESKRKGAEEEMEVTLPYSKKPFSVPNNVYIIGTMNTADRSIAIMDTALRRRFSFKEMLPDHNLLEEIVVSKDNIDVNVGELLLIINQRITYLFDREHTLGHALFMGLKDDSSIEKLATIFKKSIIPLLQEYFYEDYEKIRIVLGDNANKTIGEQFIVKEELPDDLFEGETLDEYDLPTANYEIKYENFTNINAYKKISKKL